MSKYTTQVRFICEQSAGLTESEGFDSIDEILDNSIDSVFNFDFPIFDEAYRPLLEKKILRHYYTREICEETVGLWKLRLQDRLCMIMPYYNQMYESELLEFNPFYDVNYKRTHRGNESGSSNRNESATYNRENVANKFNTEKRETDSENRGITNSNTDGTSTENYTHTDLYSDTPQGSISRLNLDGNSYLTNARKVGDDTTNTNKQNNATQSSVNGKESSTNQNSAIDSENEKRKNDISSVNNRVSFDEYVDEVVGKQSYENNSSLLKQFRETFLNIDAMIIDELKDLFFWLW